MEKRLMDISLHLLDLGKRNRLINYKSIGYRAIEVHQPSIETIFDKLTSGITLSIFPLDPVLQKYHKTIDDSGMSIEEYSTGKVKDITEGILKANDLLCYKRGYALEKICKAIYREYKSTLVEKGINSLYMTFGMAEYKEKQESYLAPLLLVPLELTLDQTHYRLKASEDEVVLNPTLAYLLKEQYKLTLEEYNENIYTFSEYMSMISKLLSNYDLSLKLQVSIGIYSFLKMNMFNDLRNHKDIVLENENIQALLGGSVQSSKPASSLKIYPVVAADQSQLEAISYTAEGKSFVLQGPPGTGKSQTITNMIATLIGNGKKVLFVSEKQAALHVVYENLRRAGLESFALELHSHKANKKEVIEELYKTAILPRYDIAHDVLSFEERYVYLTSLLEEYRTKLHEPILRTGKSLYEIYSAFLKIESPDFILPIENIEAIDYSLYMEIYEKLKLYVMYSSALGYDYHRGPFYGFISKDFMYLKYEAKQDLEKLCHFFEAMIEMKKMLTKAFPLEIHSYKDIVDTIPYLDLILQLNYFLPDYFQKEKREILCKKLEQYKKRNAYKSNSTLDQFIDLRILKLEGLEELIQVFSTTLQKPFKFLSPSYHKAKKEIKSYTKIKMQDKIILNKLEETIEYKRNLLALRKLRKSLPEEYRPVEYDALYQDAESLMKLPFSLALNKDQFIALKSLCLDLVIQFKKINTLDLKNYISRFDSLVINLIEADVEELHLKLRDMVDSIELLEVHTERLGILEELNKNSFIKFIDYSIENKVNIKRLCKNFEASYWQANILYELNYNPILRKFSSLETETILKEFKSLDLLHLETNKAHIVSLLSNQRPDESLMLGSKFSILVKEYNKSRKQKPIRLLLEEIFDLILDIKPVFLMSPLSVSTYLNSELNMFDAVIFDEASQVYAWDALGAIYRAKQCIIIGDSKQMPPSNFFTSLIEDEEEYENDRESILDKASTVFSTKRLQYHYRSKSEELIQFSNQKFYDNKLITFPQAKPHQHGLGVDFHFLMGTYEVKARTNRIEANHVVDLIFKHFEETPDKSLGVVAFSNAQADLIADLIDEQLEAFPEKRFYLTKHIEEPFFVKNLESVQGDERDVIIFSICFGYTKEHKFYQRFGPLNVLGGEKRLNVAITRAKENIIVVSSIRSTDIKLTQTESTGVALLKDYLAFAESQSNPKIFSAESTDGVISSVSKFLLQNGYLMDTHVGCSSFTIDIAILDRISKEYRVAIMIDGPSYQLGNCSDANALQERLLERLGWRFLRIFSTKWIMNREMEQKRILDFLKEDVSNGQEVIDGPQFLIKKEEAFEENFTTYPKVTEEEIRKAYHQKTPRDVIELIIGKEAPIHIDYLLKRICFMYGRTKVTALVRDYFEKDLAELEVYKDKDFLSLHPIVSLPLRISKDRSIEHIHPLELMDAIYQIVKKSNGITKDGCFKHIVGLLGYSRMSERAIEILEEALVFLKLDGKIIEKQDCLYI